MFSSIDTFPDNIALITAFGELVTYRELIARGKRISEKISDRSLVLLVASNSAEFIAGYVGFTRAGMVQLLVSESISYESLTNLISNYSPAFIFLPDSFTDFDHEGEIRYSGGGYRLLALKDSQSPTLHPDLLLLLSTSGSTGSPKMARISFTNLRENTKSIIEYLGIEARDRTITTMPLSYSFGLSILNTHLTAGASIVLTDAPVITREFWNLMENKAVTSFGGVPFFFEMLKKLKFENYKLPALRYITQAGGKLSGKLAKEFAEICKAKGYRFYIMYGQTEASPRISYFCANDHPEKLTGIGKPIPGGELWLQDSKGQKINMPGEVGELHFRGPNVSMGLAESRKELALENQNNGVLATGDMAVQDSDGFYYIVGRKNRFVKLYGLRINLLEIEDRLNSIGYEAVCSGTDEKIYIYLTNLDDPLKIETLLVEHTGIRKNDIQITKVNCIIKTSTGKIDYKFFDELHLKDVDLKKSS
jgi:long-chain acyl-CoA synthetase